MVVLLVLVPLGGATASDAQRARFADSPLTEAAQAEVTRAFGLLHRESPDAPVVDEAKLGPVSVEDLVALRWQVDLVTDASAASRSPVLRLAVLLTADGLFLESAAPSPLSALPRSRPEPDLQRVAGAFARGIASGTLASSATFGLSTCQSVWGDACANEAGVFEPVVIGDDLRRLVDGPVTGSFVSETELLVRHASGEVVQLSTRWQPQKKRKRPPVPQGPLTLRAVARWTEPPPQPYPPGHLDPGWSRWCAHDWPRLPNPQRDISGRCLLQLLSDAYGSPIQGGRIEDMMMLDFDPMPPPDEARIGMDKLAAMKRHLAHRCTVADTSACGRVLESVDSAASRKTSLFENVVLGTFTGLLRTALAGEPLPDDLQVQGRSRWSELTLDKLGAAIWARNGYAVVDPDLATFFYGDREAGSEGAGLLPLPWPDSRYSGLSETDRENLARLQRMRR